MSDTGSARMILDHLLRVRDAAVLVNERICEFFAPHSLSRLPIRVHCSRAVANSYGMRHLFYLHFRLCSSAPNASMICNAKSVMIQSNWGPDYAVDAAGKECTISMCVCVCVCVFACVGRLPVTSTFQRPQPPLLLQRSRTRTSSTGRWCSRGSV